MTEVSGPIVAIALVLVAVFVPLAFISGLTGQFFRQFALTIAVSTVISAFNSLTLSPALAALLLKPRAKGKAEPLPRFAFVLILGYLGYQFAPGLLRWYGEYHLADGGQLPGAADVLHAAGWPYVAYTAAAVGAALGWVFGNGLKVVLATVFRAFNVGFDAATNWYTRTVGILLRVSF